MKKAGDLVEQQDCQEVIIALYLYAHAALCLALAVLQGFLMSIVFVFSKIGKACCGRERRHDLQMLKFEASLALQYELYEKLEQEAGSEEFEGPLPEDLETDHFLSYRKHDQQYVFDPEAVE